MALLSFLSSGTVADAGEEEQSHRDDEGNLEFSAEFVDPAPTTETDTNSIFSVNTLDDHNVIVGFPPGTLLEIVRAQEEEEEASSVSRTIISSAPSGEVVEYLPDHNSQGVSAVSQPHPILASSRALSISTTESLYQDLPLGDDSSLNASTHHGERHDGVLENTTSDLSFAPSMLDSSILGDSSSQTVHSTCTPPSATANNNNNPVAVRHDRTTFVSVGNRLATVPEDKAATCWYSHFNDHDWDQFRQAADAVLDAMEEEGPARDPPVVVLPPTAPPANPPASTSYVASDIVPAEFVCSLCRDVVVGATTLGCGCPASTVCAACWESYVTVHADLVMVDNNDDDDYVAVENRSESAITTTSPSCPSCHGSVHRKPVPCHALDVAILQAIQNVPTTTTTHGDNTMTMMAQLQQAYYYRLNQWRFELQQRLDEWNKQQAVEREQLLAQCIQREEELLWAKQTTRRAPFWKNKTFEVAIFLLATSFLLVRK